MKHFVGPKEKNKGGIPRGKSLQRNFFGGSRAQTRFSVSAVQGDSFRFGAGRWEAASRPPGGWQIDFGLARPGVDRGRVIRVARGHVVLSTRHRGRSGRVGGWGSAVPVPEGLWCAVARTRRAPPAVVRLRAAAAACGSLGGVVFLVSGFRCGRFRLFLDV